MAAHAERPSVAKAVSFESGVAQIAGLIGVFGGLLGVLYVIGGAVMWLRFDAVGIPPDQAVPLVPKADLLVVGLRVMVLPALATAGVLIALASIRRGRALEFQRLSDELESRGGDEARIAEIKARHAELRARPRPLDALPGPLRRPARIALLAVVALLALVVPFSFGAFAWPIALAGLVLYWLRLRREAPIGSGKKFPVWRIAIAGVLAAALISVARQTDPPTQLPSVQAFVSDAPGLSRQLGLPAARANQPIELSGVLVKADGSDLAIGDPTSKRILTVPRSHVTSMIVGPPLDVRAPPESLLSRIIPGGTAWAVTPLEVWCVQLRYGWTQLLDACKGAPSIETQQLRVDRRTVRGIRVRCPGDAPGLCRGYLALEALNAPRAEGGGGEPARTPALSYAVEPGGTTTIPLAVGDFFKRYRPEPDGRIHADVRLLLGLTPTLDSVVSEAERELVVKTAGRDADGGDRGNGDRGDDHRGDGDRGDSNPGDQPPAPPGSGGGDTGGGDTGSGDAGNGDTGNGDTGNGDAGNDDAGNGDAGAPPPISYGPSPPPSQATEPIGPAPATG